MRISLMDLQHKRPKIDQNVLQKAVAWTLGQNSLTYKEKLVANYILLLSLCHGLHAILMHSGIMNGNINIDWTKYKSRLDYVDTRNSETRNFNARPMRLEKCKSDFWFRASQLTNVFNDFLNKTFSSTQTIKPNFPTSTKPFSGKSTARPTPATGDCYVTAALVKRKDCKNSNYHFICKRTCIRTASRQKTGHLS